MSSIFEEDESYGEGTLLEWVPCVESFLCFVQLRRATQIIGYSQMVCYGFLVILTFYDIIIWMDVFNYDEIWFDVPRAMDVNAMPRCFFGALLPYGIHKNCKGYILAWLLVQQPILLENISWYLLEEIPFFVLVMKSWTRTILALGEIAFSIYMVMVVNSYYKTLGGARGQIRPIVEQTSDH